MTPTEYEELNRFAPGWSADGSDDYDDTVDDDVDGESEEEKVAA